MENHITNIIEAVANSYGQAFFERVVVELGRMVHADYTMIARVNPTRFTAESYALAQGDAILPPIEYALNNTPCANLINQETCIYQSQAANLFPEDTILNELGIEGYMGTALLNSKKQVMGILIVMFKEPIVEIEAIKALFRLFSGRITAEIERLDYERQLKEHAEELEQEVKRRTQELRVRNEELSLSNRTLREQGDVLQNALKTLQQAQQQLIQTEKMASLGLLAAGVAHEINNPLNFIKHGIQGLEDYFYGQDIEVPELVTKLIDAVKEGSTRAERIVHSLNDFSRSSESLNEPCDIHEILDNCLIMLSSQYKYHIDLESNFEAQHPVIQGCLGKLHQAFFNIIINAIQAMPKRGKLELYTRNTHNGIEVQVADTGHGIAPEHLTKISEPFFTTKPPGEGTGMGLALAFQIIHDHQGHIYYQSEIQQGTTASVELPFERVKAYYSKNVEMDSIQSQ